MPSVASTTPGGPITPGNTAPPPGMGKRVAKGAIWTIAANLARIASAIVILPILTRLLSPEDFGLMQIAAPFLFFMLIFHDFGMQPALALVKDPTDRLWSTAFWTGIFGAVAMATALMFAAPLIAQFYNEPRAAQIIQALSLCMLVGGLMIVPGGWMIREMQFRALAIVEVSTVTSGLVAALAAAYAGWGVWALVVQQLVMFFLKSAALLTLSRAPIGLRFEWTDLQKILGFSLGMTNVRVIWFLGRNIDGLIIGKFLGATMLGFYSVAVRVMMMPIEIFANGIAQVLIPSLGQIQEDKPRLKAAVLRTYRTIAIFTMPAMAGIAALSAPLTLVVFGEKFAPSAWPIAALAVHGATQSLLSSQGPVFMALGRLDVMMRWALFTLAVLTTFLLIGVHWGLRGAALGYLAAGLVCAPFNFRALLSLLDGRLSDVARAAGRPALIAVGMGLAVHAASLAAPQDWANLSVLVACVPLGVCLYLAGLFIFDRSAIREVMDIGRQVLAR